jgi:O-antigen/teichoic acid export membrane protein
MARAGAPLLGATVVSLLFHRVDILMLGKLVSEADVGLYGAAVRIVDVVVLAPRILATAVYPAMRRSRDEDGPVATAGFVGESTRLSLVVCSAIGLAVWILAPLALRWIPGESFLPATPALRVLSFGIVLQSASYMLGRLLFADERESDFLWIGGVSLAANVILNSILIPRMGIEGAAWGTMLAYVVNASMYFGFARRRGFPVALHRSLLGPVLAVAVAAVAAWSVADRPLVVPALTLIGTWLLGLAVQGILRPSDLARVWAMVRGSGSER